MHKSEKINCTSIKSQKRIVKFYRKTGQTSDKSPDYLVCYYVHGFEEIKFLDHIIFISKALMVFYCIYFPFCWDEKFSVWDIFCYWLLDSSFEGEKEWMHIVLFSLALLCGPWSSTVSYVHTWQGWKKCFQLNLLPGLSFNPFSHSTYIRREGIIILPSVGSILLPMLTWGTTWGVSFNKFTSKKLLLLVNPILLLLPEVFWLCISNWA